MIIALDGRPLMTRQLSGADQHARSITAQWASMALPHQFILLCDKAHQKADLYDNSFIEQLPGNFRQLFIGNFQMSLGWHLGGRLLNRVSRILSRYKADIYHSFTPTVPRTTVCPVVQTIHDLAFELDPKVRHSPESRERRHLARLGAQAASKIIAVSSQTKLDIVSVYRVPPEKVAIVYNGIHPDYKPAQNPELHDQLRQKFHFPRQYIFAVGSEIPRRNYARMFDALQIVWRQDPNIHLVIAGRNVWSTTNLYQRAQQTGHLSRIHFITAPTDSELAQLYRDATITCCASSFEGFGMSVLESMSCGTPAACSDMRSLREVAEDAAIYFPHDDAEFMGQTLVGLIEDVEYRRQLKYRGLARSQLFTWKTAAQMILQILEKVSHQAAVTN